MKNIFLVLGFIMNVVWGYSQQGEINISDYQTDIQYLKDTLPTKHPNLFFHQTQEDFNKGLDAIANTENLSAHNRQQIMMQLREAIAEIGDPHTNFGFYGLLAEEGHFPLKIFWFADGIWIIGAGSEYQSTIGKKLIAIDNMPIEKVIEKLSYIDPKNEPYFMHKNMHFILMMNAILKSYDITNGDSALFTLEDVNGARENIKIDVTEGMYTHKNFSHLEQLPDFWQNVLSDNDDFFRLKYHTEDSILVIQYNVCWGREVEDQYGDKEASKKLPSFNDFKNRIFEILAENPVKKVLFDLRFNGGGSSPQGTKLVEELSKVETINQKGKLFVAISQHSFSSAVINAMNFRQMTNATLIGQPTGGSPNHYGEVRTLKLPKTGLEVYYSSKYFKFIDEDLSAVMPDVMIETNYSDISNGSDPIYNYVKNHYDSGKFFELTVVGIFSDHS